MSQRTKSEAAANPRPGEWTRAQDALIAERADGLNLVFFRDDYWTGSDPLTWRRVDSYNTDLAAVARAMEAWRLQEPEKRAFFIERGHGVTYARCRHLGDEGREDYRGESGSTAEACAWALWRAVGGGA